MFIRDNADIQKEISDEYMAEDDEDVRGDFVLASVLHVLRARGVECKMVSMNYSNYPFESKVRDGWYEITDDMVCGSLHLLEVDGALIETGGIGIFSKSKLEFFNGVEDFLKHVGCHPDEVIHSNVIDSDIFDLQFSSSDFDTKKVEGWISRYEAERIGAETLNVSNVAPRSRL